jgi:acyl-CoA thioester hydrolase
VHPIRVRYAEVDGQGVVFNAHWLTYFDEACTRFVESLGFGAGFWIHEFDVMLVHAVLDWSGSARFDDWIQVEVAPVRLGRSSFDLRYRATVDRAGICEATITYVSVPPGGGAAVPIPAPVRAALESRLAAPHR